MAETLTKSRISTQALLSLLLVLLIMPFLALTGLPAFFMGLHSLREINASEGRLTGARIAVAGLILGVVGTLGTVIGFAALVFHGLRQDAGRMNCENNLRIIGMSLAFYEDQHKSLPPGTIPSATLPPEKRLSWYVSILPYLEMERGGQKSKRPRPWPQLYEKFDQAAPWDAEVNRQAVAMPIQWVVCPSSSERAVADAPAITTYPGIAGVGRDAAVLPGPDQEDKNLDPDAGVFGYNRRFVRKDITSGLSGTMMVAETSFELGPWAAGGFPTVRGIDPAQQPYIGPGRPFGGNHRGGLNVLFADGKTRFLSDAIDPAVFGTHARIPRDEADH